MGSKNIVPIVFSCDHNLAQPLVVCLDSLLMSADPTTHYEIYLLHNRATSGTVLEKALAQVTPYSEYTLKMVDVGDAWAGAFEIRGITIASYYRLLLADILPDKGKAIYADVDMIFRSDLFEVYDSSLKDNQLVAGVREVDDFINPVNKVHDYYREIGCDLQTYINGGFLVLNLETMRREGLVERFMSHAGKQYLTQDQDILNIECRGRIELLPMRWNFTSVLYDWSSVSEEFYKTHQEQIEDAGRRGVVHYTGAKPWNGFCKRYDLWWSVWRRSQLYDSRFLHTVEERISSVLNRAPLRRRIRWAVRDFFKGNNKK